MEIQKLSLDEFEESDINIGLVRLAKKVPNFEFFFKTNTLNNFTFSRAEDLIVQGEYYDYIFPVFSGTNEDCSLHITFIENRSVESVQKKEIVELFAIEENIKILLKNNSDIDYIIKTSEVISDFSLILLPENLAFPVQEISVSPDSELFQILQYYE